MSTIANTRDYTSQMPTMCYCRLQSSRRVCKYTLIMPLLAYIFKKEIYARRGMVAVHILPQSQCTGKFIYKALILDNKQLLSTMIECKATQVPYTTRIALLADSYSHIFCSNFPAILCIIVIASYIPIWRQHFWTKLKVASY